VNGGPARARGGAPTVLGDVARRMPRLTQRMAAAHAALFLRTQGRVLGSWFGSPILVLETVGRRSGTPRMTPLVYLPHGDGFAVVPANAGAGRPPAWWLNLEAAGAGFVMLGGARQRIAPAIAAGIEHERLWRRLRAVTPVEHYQRGTRRTLPVVILTPSEAAPLRHGAPASTSRLALQTVG
jgi:deazaflavin-dependent oxidoreductase (nitroreductase family)